MMKIKKFGALLVSAVLCIGIDALFEVSCPTEQ